MTSAPSVAKRVARRLIRKGLAIPRLRAVIERELADAAPRRRPRAERAKPRAGDAAPVPPQPSRGTFVDRHGVSHALEAGHRDRLKPSWRAMCDPVLAARPPTDQALRGRVDKAAAQLPEVERTLEQLTGGGLRGRLLEVGCYDGSTAFSIARLPGTEVVGSDLARYYVVQRPGTASDDEVENQQRELATLRERARTIAGVEPGRVEFVEDDINHSSLAPGTFDAVVSFEVLEHLADPAGAFASIARLLRPGGVSYHVYNPFFAINGGHSLVTLDVPWGHVRFDHGDVERYLREARPSEAEQALRFYHDSLNRMTLADLRLAVEDAGLEILALVPWHDRRLVVQLPHAALEEVRRNYPTATLADLLATFVTLVARRPSGA